MVSAIVHITQAIQADIDGDGQTEFLIAATTPRPDFVDTNGEVKPGDYSFVALYRPGDRTTKITLLTAFFPSLSNKRHFAAEKYKIAAIADLNGDGKMEVVVSGAMYEGSDITLYSFTNGRLKAVLKAGDGV